MGRTWRNSLTVWPRKKDSRRAMASLRWLIAALEVAASPDFHSAPLLSVG